MNLEYWLKFYLTFDGRVDRKSFWVFGLIPILLIHLALIILEINTFENIKETNIISAFFVFIIIYVEIALFVKRFHDMNQSGWIYILVSLLSLIIIYQADVNSSAETILYYLIFLLITAPQGTEGQNRFGEDPLENRE